MLRRGRSLIAIEAKAARRWRPELAKGLRAVEGLAGLRRLVVYQGREVLQPERGIEVLPVKRFVEELERGLW